MVSILIEIFRRGSNNTIINDQCTGSMADRSRRVAEFQAHNINVSPEHPKITKPLDLCIHITPKLIFKRKERRSPIV